MEHLHAYVHEDTARQLRAHAHANDRSLAGELRRALRLYCEMMDRRSIEANGAAVDHGGGGGTNSSSAPSPP